MADVTTLQTAATTPPANGFTTSEFAMTIISGALVTLITYMANTYNGSIVLAGMAILAVLLAGAIYCVNRFVLKSAQNDILSDLIQAYTLVQKADVTSGNKVALPTLPDSIAALGTQTTTTTVTSTPVAAPVVAVAPAVVVTSVPAA